MSDPVAWYVRHAADEPPLLFTDEKQANDAAFTSGIGARPLYRRQVSSQQNLTAAEREAIAYYLGTGGPHGVDATLVALLSRTGSDSRQTCDNAAECRKHGEKTPERDRLTAAERGAVDRARIAFRDMDHNAMTMQQLEDYEALCGLLARLGGCAPQLDCGADRTSVASQRCRDTGGQPLKSAPITLTDAEREAVRYMIAAAKFGQRDEELTEEHAATLRGLLERLSP